MTPNKKGVLKVEYVPIKSVKPAKGNTRVHPPEQVSQIIASIDAFGWTKPIIVDERREILAGHGALQAALQKGLTEVPIIARHGLTQAHYDTLVKPWATVIGKVHPDDQDPA